MKDQRKSAQMKSVTWLHFSGWEQSAVQKHVKASANREPVISALIIVSSTDMQDEEMRLKIPHNCTVGMIALLNLVYRSKYV